tara:strand:+ start:2127 stop:3320 length:1194 start_codon:yes stop_codon:yes gene_type:complete
MSFYYVGKDAEGTEQTFSKRLMYRADTAGSSYTNLVDFNFAEKHLYGRVTKFHFVPMIPQSIIAPITKLHSIEVAGGNQAALNFVVDAFRKLVQQFAKAGLTNSINPADPFLSNPKVFKSYLDPTRLYSEHLTTYKTTLTALLNMHKANIVNFDQFVLKILPFLEKSARKNPFTMPAFVKSTYCPINVSGLVIEIADLDPNDDEQKIEQFYQSLNWEFYLNACRSYGFMVDRMIPWRIVADIGSVSMLEYAAAYGLTSTDQILKGVYTKVHSLYFQTFKKTFYNLYHQARNEYLYEPIDCPDTVATIKITVPQSYSKEAFFEKYSDLYFLNLYCKIRFFEEESQFSESEQNYIIDDCIELAQHDLTKALDSFENILNKPFDYRGSLGYISSRFDEQL